MIEAEREEAEMGDNRADALTEAEASLRAAEAALDEAKASTIGGGIMLSEEAGRKLKQLRGDVETAKRRLDELRNS